MPAVTTRAPGLNKPKSKLRLRLGLGGKDSPAKPVVPALPHDEPQSATSSQGLQPGSSYGTTSTNNAPTESLDESTNSTSSTQSAVSRGDSRSAFALDISPSPGSSHGPNHNFDTISYATASPQSGAFDSRVPSTYSSSTVLYQQDAYHQSTHSLATSHLHEELSEIQEELNHSHPAIAHAVEGADDVFSMTDEQLGDKFAFSKEIGFGNWGSVWQARPRRTRADWEYNFAQTLNLGKKSASVSGGLVAMKLVHRIRDETTAARVKALWSEMKIIRSLRHEPHPSIINFEAFIITPSYALVCMPFLYELIPVSLPPARAIPYFRQLASAVGYLHERGITHNDIKPANVLLSYTDIPVLVDFGFANQYDVRSKNSFLSNVCWGTPEYLDPQRAYSLPHDERASDVWSLGVTMFEILIGRTPFEEDEQEEFSSPEELQVYYQRSSRGIWIGEWRMPRALQQLLQAMICPDPQYRISAMQAYHHPSLALAAPTAIHTPQFVRAAQGLEEETFVPVNLPLPAPRYGQEESAKKKKPTKKKERKAVKDQIRTVTPALSESIKQHVSVPKPKPAVKGHQGEGDKENGAEHIKIEITPSPKKKSLVIIKSNENLLAQAIKRNMEDDATPTRTGKAAQPLRIQELATGDKPLPRTSAGQSKTLSRTTSHNSLATTARVTDSHRSSTVSAISTTSTATVQPKNQEEAVLKTMRSLEGARRLERTKSRDALNNVKRPAPSPPRPRSLDAKADNETKVAKGDPRRSLGIERTLAALKEESPAKLAVPSPSRMAIAPVSPPRKSPRKGQPAVASPPRPRMNTRPTEVVRDGRRFPASVPSSPITPLTELRHKILTMDKDSVERFRKLSAELAAPQPVVTSSSGAEPPKKLDNGARATNDKALDEQERRDKFASCVKDVERLVAEARKAVEEGREAAMPDIADLAMRNGISMSGMPTSAQVPAGPIGGGSTNSGQTVTAADDSQPDRRFGVTPKRASAVPMHLRTSSVQVEPATPPKWMVEEEAARELAAKSNALPVEIESKTSGLTEDDRRMSRDSVARSVVMRKGGKKERPTVSHVLKLFGAEKEKTTARSQTPEPMSTVPLKSAGNGPTLRAAPSTPALRTTTLRPSKALGRKSESNLRNFSTMPSLTALLADAEAELANSGSMRPSPRRAVYEDLLASEPGVVRQGDGWSSWSSGRGMAKTTSIGSLRERALAFLRDDHRESKDLRDAQRDSLRDSKDIGSVMSGRERHIVDLAAEVEAGREGMKRTSRSDLRAMGRPATPGANSILMGGRTVHDKKGIFGKLKGIMGKKGMEKLEEV